MNIELEDSATQILDTVKEYSSGLPNKKLEIILSDEIWKDVEPGAVVKLLAKADDAKFFDIKATKPESLTIPKK